MTLHNAEEAMTFGRALHLLPDLVPAAFVSVAAGLTHSTMLVALGIVTLLAFSVALLARREGSATGLWLTLVVQATVALNALNHLVVALVLFRGYAPGLITALLVNAPFAAYTIRRAWREQWVSHRAFGAVFPAAVVLHGPLLLGALWLAGTID